MSINLSQAAPPTRRAALAGLAAAAVILGSGGCQQEIHYAFLVEVRAPAEISALKVQVKQYHLDGSTTVYAEFEEPISAENKGYLLDHGGEPLRLDVKLSDPGRFAVHLVGEPPSPESERMVTTLCREIEGVEYEPNAVLGRLRASNDADDDTFPESASDFCATQADDDLPCETSCNSAEYLAMADCNLPQGLEPPAGCGALPEPSVVNPFEVDPCGDCYDQDCYGGDTACADRDGDGFPGGQDCNDDDPTINPDAEEICNNGIDENCQVDITACGGDPPCDADGDGFLAIRSGSPGCGDDCDDSNPAIYPGAAEGCGSDPDDPEACPGCFDGIDNDCDTQRDENCFSDDLDNDGVPVSEDCDDCNAGVGPGIAEVCGDGVDNDCDGIDRACNDGDGDGDGFSGSPAGEDCDDGEPRTYPGAPENCADDVAQNCISAPSCEADDDGDGFDPSFDCDNSAAEVNPWALELCDPTGVDEDCDGQINEVAPAGIEGQGCVIDSASGLWYSLEYETSVDHCGGCRNRCCVSTCDCRGNRCVGGECRCGEGPACTGDATDYCCSDGCRDLSHDQNNCGACGRACLDSEVCQPSELRCGLGACSCEHEPDGAVCPREPGSVCCAGVGCVDTETDPHHCGGCDQDCTAASGGVGPLGDRCALDAEGTPQCLCGTSLQICTGDQWCTELTEPEGEACGCQDLNSNVLHCGTCNNACDTNESCSSGRCRCEGGGNCSGEPTDFCCLGVGCVDLNADRANCGSCGVTCGPGESCVDGECRCGGDAPCGPEQDCCLDECRNVLTDAAFCGTPGTGEGCSNSCGDNPCVDGRCECPAGWTDCAGDCDCNTGDGERCCDGVCTSGECCTDADCEGTQNPHCDTSDYSCYCRPHGNACPPSKQCCPDGCDHSC